MTEPPPQPILTDGDVVLRPWSDGDIDVTRAQDDDTIAYWFGRGEPGPWHEQQATAVARWRAQYAAERSVVNFVVEHQGEVAGGVEIRQRGDHLGELSWALYPSHRGRGVAVRALRLLVAYAFDELGLERLEAYVEPGNARALRLASRAGLRREGVLRRSETTGDRRPDKVLLARLVDDADPRSRDGFIAMLNAGLPTKRLISHGLLRDGADRLLLCELTYKNEWDLPGGVVEPGESPAAGLEREVREELGLEVQARTLRTVNWLPAWHAWDDACVFVFDLGRLDADSVASIVLQPTEIRAVHWCEEEVVRERAAAATATMLDDLGTDPWVPYREAGRQVGLSSRRR